jgi:glutamate carboxypeptidase
MNQEAIRAALGLAPADAADRVLERVRRYVEIETPSGDAAAIDRLSRLVEAELTAIGATTAAFDAGPRGRNLRADVEGAEPGLAPLLVLTHIDTVHPAGTLANLPWRVADGRAEGPGIYDMKVGLALMIEALALLRARGRRPRRPVRLLATCDEEIGSHASKELMRAAADGAFAALVPEPSLPDGSVKTARKGVASYRLEIDGRAAHAGVAPEQGISAVVEFVRQAPRVLDLADAVRGTTINIGTVHAGTAVNVVPARAVAEIDVRVPDAAEDARVRDGLLGLRPVLDGARVTLVNTETRPPLERSPGVVRLFEHARGVAAALGVALGEGGTGGGSDGSFVAGFGIPTLDGIGPRGGGAHASDEHVRTDDLPFRLALYVRLLETL